MNIRDVLFCLPEWGDEVTTLEEFSELVADINDAALDPSLWDQALKRITAAAGGRCTGLIVSDRQRRRPPQLICDNLDPAQIRKYDEYYGRLDFFLAGLGRLPPGLIVSDRAVATEAQRRGEFYNDWMYPNDLGHGLGVKLADCPSGLCALVVARSIRSEPFATPGELRLVKLLVPHLQSAMQAQLGFGSLSLIRDGALDLVEQWRHGCVLVSLAGQVLYANRAANEIAAAEDGLCLGISGLRAFLAAEDAALQRLIRQACIGTGLGPCAGGRLAISRGAGRKPYMVTVMPVRSSRAHFLNGPPAALVLIVDPERAAHLPPEDLQKLYDLAPAEAEVAVRVARGHGLQYVADELRVTLSTVRVHLQRVFEKTGVHRQTELVRMLIELETSNLPDRLAGAAE
jgi:DNA-binding CsgD family transcriptional regulator